MKSIIYYISFIASYIFAHECDISLPTPFLPIPPPILMPKPTIKPIIDTEPTITVSQEPMTVSQEPMITVSRVAEPPMITVSRVAEPPMITVSPIDVRSYNLKATDIYNILETHNNERNLTDLDSLSWDVGLQTSSQVWSNELASRNCVLEHKLFSSAQNLYGGYGWIDPDFQSAVKLWIDEKNLLNKPNITFQDVGHYLIIVSDAYSKVGCASAINVENDCFVITCNYN